MLCLHGFGSSLETWRDILPYLQGRFRLWVIDLKGFGRSSKPDDGAYSLKDQARIVATFIQEQDLNGIILAGHSYGGALALLAYLNENKLGVSARVASMLLIDSAGYPQTLPFFVSIPRTPILNRLVLDLTPSRLQARVTLKRLFWDSTKVTEDRIQRYAKFFSAPGAKTALINSARQILPSNADEFVKRIPEIPVPTLIVWGEMDPAIPLDHARRFSRDIRESRLEIIADCGHVPHEEKPADTARAILNFFP